MSAQLVQEQQRKLEQKEVAPVEEPAAPEPVEPAQPVKEPSGPLTLAQVAAANVTEVDASAEPAVRSVYKALSGYMQEWSACTWTLPCRRGLKLKGIVCCLQVPQNPKLARRQRELEEEEAERKRKEAAAAKLRALDDAIAAREVER